MSTVLTGDRPDIEALAANAVRVTVEVIWAPFVSGDYLAGLSPVGLGPLIKTLSDTPAERWSWRSPEDLRPRHPTRRSWHRA